jgi:hypothetical protein
MQEGTCSERTWSQRAVRGGPRRRGRTQRPPPSLRSYRPADWQRHPLISCRTTFPVLALRTTNTQKNLSGAKAGKCPSAARSGLTAARRGSRPSRRCGGSRRGGRRGGKGGCRGSRRAHRRGGARSASTPARGANARTAGMPASASITASGAGARTVGAPASARLPT